MCVTVCRSAHVAEVLRDELGTGALAAQLTDGLRGKRIQQLRNVFGDLCAQLGQAPDCVGQALQVRSQDCKTLRLSKCGTVAQFHT